MILFVVPLRSLSAASMIGTKGTKEIMVQDSADHVEQERSWCRLRITRRTRRRTIPSNGRIGRCWREPSIRAMLMGSLFVWLAFLSQGRATASSSTAPSSSTAQRTTVPRTTLTGYGSRHTKRSAFANDESKASLKAKRAAWKRKTHKLWIRKTSDTIWFFDRDSGRVVTLSTDGSQQWVLDLRRLFKVDRKKLMREKWVPVEGLYGLYSLSSGIVLGIITVTSRRTCASRPRKWIKRLRR